MDQLYKASYGQFCTVGTTATDYCQAPTTQLKNQLLTNNSQATS